MPDDPVGIVAFNDMYFHMDRVAAAVLDSGLKAALGATIFDAGEGSSVGEELDAALRWNEEVASSGEPRLRTYLAPHSMYTCSPELLEQVVEQAHATGAGIHFHLSEDRRQFDEAMKRCGRSPVQQADALGIFDVPGGCVAAHTLVLEMEDVLTLASKKVHVPHCPITYAKLAMEMFPLPPLDGGRIAVSVLPDIVARPLARLEPYGMLILITLIILVPILGNQLGANLNFVSQAISAATGFVIRTVLMLTANT